MKTLILFSTVIFSGIFFSCQSNDQKDETKPYQNYDTTTKMENLNTVNPDSVKSMGSPNGDLH